MLVHSWITHVVLGVAWGSVLILIGPVKLIRHIRARRRRERAALLSNGLQDRASSRTLTGRELWSGPIQVNAGGLQEFVTSNSMGKPAAVCGCKGTKHPLGTCYRIRQAKDPASASGGASLDSEALNRIFREYAARFRPE